MKLVTFLALSVATFAIGCAAPTDEDATASSDSALGAKKTLTASSVVRSDVSSSFLGAGGPLGEMGPIGAWGPLGALGPVGDNSWNPPLYMPAFQPVKGGPLSEKGPLGPNGPLAHIDALDGLGGESKELGPGGYLTVLGPVGALGALGPLGPLGPMGGHGYAHDDDGNYLDRAGHVVRTVDVPYEGATRTYELVEKYTEEAAKDMKDNDSSFMAMGSMSNEADDYSFTARDAQLVTIVVVPENQLSDFDLEVKDAQGHVVARSNESSYIDWAQLSVKKGEKLTARVTAKSTNWMFPTYRLIVTGATKYVH